MQTLDGSFTSTNEFLDSLNKQTPQRPTLQELRSVGAMRDAVAAIAGYYQKIEGIEGELSVLLDRRASQDAERTKQFKDTYQEYYSSCKWAKVPMRTWFARI